MKKFVIDCDTGVDDAQAIVLALSRTDIQIIAITCTTGNVSSKCAAANSVRVLAAANVNDIPVFIGACKPISTGPTLKTEHSDASKYHGSDGLGDAVLASDERLPSHLIQKEHSAVALCRLAREYPGEITLVALGPLTNVALAFRLDESFPKNLKEIYIMGGAIYGKGNVTVTGEFNFVFDPEAANLVLEETICPTYLMSWEVCCDSGLDWTWHKDWVQQNIAIMRFVNAISGNTCKMDRDVWKTLYCPPDVLAMALAIEPAFCLKQLKCHCLVETGRNLMTRGQLIVDWNGLLKQRPAITICMAWDKDVLRKLLENIPLSAKFS